jgi:hypothetical protein
VDGAVEIKRRIALAIVANHAFNPEERIDTALRA